MKSFLTFILTINMLFFATRPAQAQEEASNSWGDPVNLSQSGAATAPRLLAGPGGTLQAFWLDEFDGLMTAVYNGGSWSVPEPSPLNEAGAEETLAVMPVLFAGADGWAHAFWQPEGAGGPLAHSRLLLGSAVWSPAETVAESVLAYGVTSALPETQEAGALTLAYYRTAHTSQVPAGVYVKRLPAGNAAWRASVWVYSSIYFRKLELSDAALSLFQPGDGRLYLAWRDARLGLDLAAVSPDGGNSWSEPEQLASPDITASLPRLAGLPGDGLLRLWSVELFHDCRLYAQTSHAAPTTTAAAPSPTATPSRPPRRTPTPTPAIEAVAPATAANQGVTWSEPALILPGLAACPQGDAFFVHNDRLLWAWGQGTGSISLAAYDPRQNAWSEPARLSFSFEDPQTGQPVGLSDLQLTLSDGRLAVLGVDANTREVWAVAGETGAVDLAYAPPSPWSDPLLLSGGDPSLPFPADLAITLDTEGAAHLVWSQAGPAGPASILEYARVDSGGASQPVEIFYAVEREMARQPVLMTGPGPWLHLAWSGAQTGQILYSRAIPADASFSEGWQAPSAISPGMAAWPQLGQDAAGQLYALYITPMNEGRGVYLAVSPDQGASWSAPELVFDAAQAGWALVDHPALAVAPDGTLFAAWVQVALAGESASNEIFFSFAPAPVDGEVRSWAEPVILAGPGAGWPRLAVAGGALTLLYTSADGSITARQLPLDAVQDGWDAPTRLPGLDRAVPPVGLAVTGPALSAGGLVIAAAARLDGGLAYSTWDGERWSGVEAVLAPRQAHQGLGAAAAARPEGGQLGVAWLALPPAQSAAGSIPVLLYLERSLPKFAIQENGMAIPPRPAASATPFPATMPVPSPTPDYNHAPQPTGPPVSPMILGSGVGVLAGLLFVGVRFLTIRRR